MHHKTKAFIFAIHVQIHRIWSIPNQFRFCRKIDAIRRRRRFFFLFVSIFVNRWLSCHFHKIYVYDYYAGTVWYTECYLFKRFLLFWFLFFFSFSFWIRWIWTLIGIWLLIWLLLLVYSFEFILLWLRVMDWVLCFPMWWLVTNIYCLVLLRWIVWLWKMWNKKMRTYLRNTKTFKLKFD